jgi:putative ABC transport system permease protein
MKDVPHNSHLEFDFLVSINSIPGMTDKFVLNKRTYSNTFYLYFKTENELPLADVQHLVDQTFQTVRSHDGELGYEYQTPVQPLDDIYFNAHTQFEPTPGGNLYYVYMFVAIGIALLVITIINFINISTSRSLRRVKEVGIRKTLGTTQRSLIVQFLTESIMTTVITTGISYFLAFLLVARLSDSFYTLELSLLYEPIFIAAIFLYAILLGLFAGIYPSVKIAFVNASAALKGHLSIGKETLINPRNALVLFQLIMSITLISFLFLVSRQLDYLSTRSLSHGHDNMLYFIQPATADASQWAGFQESLQSHSSTHSVGGSEYPILATELGEMNTAWVWPNEDTKNILTTAWNAVGYNFVETMGIELVEGRTFSKDFATDTLAILINETVQRSLGLNDPLGTTLSWWRGNFKIVGILKDFHFKPFANKISPVIFILDPAAPPILMVQSTDVRATVEEAKIAWDQAQIDAPFSTNYFDETVKQMMMREDQLSGILKGFSGLALIIMAIGMAGLIGYTTSRKQKEVVIRKVYGASALTIVRLLNVRFFVLLLTAAVCSLFAFLTLSQYWLSAFEYKVTWSVWDFILACSTVILISLIVVESYAIKSAFQNPAVVLREE